MTTARREGATDETRAGVETRGNRARRRRRGIVA